MDYDLWLRCLGRYSFVKLPVVISRFSSGGVSGSDAVGVAIAIERTVVQLINKQAPPDATTLAKLLAQISSVKAKRALRGAIGPAAFLGLKRLVGRDTPSVWAPPPTRAGQPADRE